MSHPPAVLHVGLAKTATTTLQRDFFPALTGCVVVTRWGETARAAYDRLAQHPVTANDDDYLEDDSRAFLAEAVRGGSGNLLPQFKPSNARLAGLTGLPLADVGYPLPAEARGALEQAAFRAATR